MYKKISKGDYKIPKNVNKDARKLIEAML